MTDPLRAPIAPRMAISRTFDRTIMVSEATMLKAATMMMIIRNRAMISFCISSAMNRLWFRVSQSMMRGS